jgi:hypothetical protein
MTLFQTLRQPCQPVATGALAATQATEPMTLHELQDALAICASDKVELVAALKQVGAVLEFLRDNGTDEATLVPLQSLGRALYDTRYGNVAALLKPLPRTTKQRRPPVLQVQRETLVALLVEAFVVAWPSDETRRLDRALERVARAMGDAGIRRDSMRPHRGGPEFDVAALEHWRRRAMRHADWPRNIATVKEQRGWPEGPGDTVAADALLADWLPDLAVDFARD